MFRFLLWRGITDIKAIFKEGEPQGSVDHYKERLDRVNSSAQWFFDNPESGLSDQLNQSERMSDFVFDAARSGNTGDSFPIPSSLVRPLQAAFCLHYNNNNMFLIGRADHEAYSVQEKYVEDVVSVLKKDYPGCAARALLVLGKAYGRSSIPLLSVASIATFWKLADSVFYKRQTNLVSSIPACHCLY